MHRAIYFCLTLGCLVLTAASVPAEPIKVGVPLALTGDLAAMGADTRDAIEFANEILGGGRYHLIFEDSKCNGKDAVDAAHKLLNVDHVQYVVGLSCNTELLSSARLYEKAKVVVIAASATSGDIRDVGDHIFRPFPADQFGAKVLYHYMAKRHSRIAVISEEEEYAALLERNFRAENENGAKLPITFQQYPRGVKDFRSIATRLLAHKPDAIFLNAAGEATFIPLVRQLKELRIAVPLYAEYMPGSKVVLDQIGPLVEGMHFSDLPDARSLSSDEGARLLDELERRRGPARSISLVRPIAFEAFRMLNDAVQSGRPVREFLKTTRFKSVFLGEVHFDPHNSLVGIEFEMKQIRAGRPERIAP